MLNTFITKNIQEYIFQILNSGEKQNITNNKYYFPFYIKTLQRILNYIQKNDNPNKKISLFINEIFNHQILSLLFLLNKLLVILVIISSLYLTNPFLVSRLSLAIFTNIGIKSTKA